MNQTPPRSPAGSNVAGRLALFKGAQQIAQHLAGCRNAASLLKAGDEIARLFGVRTFRLFRVDRSAASLVRVVHGNDMPERIHIDERSVIGVVATHRRIINLADVNDVAALQAISPEIGKVSTAEGAPGPQLLALPIVSAPDAPVQGVLVIAGTESGNPFSSFEEEGLLVLIKPLADLLSRLRAQVLKPQTRFEALVFDGLVTAEDLAEVLRVSAEERLSAEELLVRTLGVTPEQVGAAAARFFNVPYEPFRPERIKPLPLLKHLKRSFVVQSGWVPLEEGPEGLVVMAIDPERVRAAGVVQNVFVGQRFSFRVTTPDEFARTVSQFFDATLDESSVDDLLNDLGEDDESTGQADELTAASDNELVKLVNKIIIDAHRQGASDIHIEPRPGKEKTLIRFRKDGALVPYIDVPASYRNPLVTRIKIMCDLDISERRKPQDGKIRFRRFAPLDIELRVATLPTAGGTEDVVMRILANSEPIPLDGLGLSPYNHEQLQKVIAKPYGIFFVCGPTGSGKTTTLHSILGHINTPETKIWTAEDPVEITQRGLRQVQVNRKAGLDFATMMRAFLRADPDVIMVGEMRDHETVAVGIEASLTGHLVFSTLHTNSAPESVVRLLDMGMDPFNFADALLGVLAQRLARRLCTRCSTSYEPSDEEIRHLLDEYCEDLHLTRPFQDDPVAAREQVLAGWRSRHADGQGRFHLRRAVGCSECNKGYKGRVGLHELMLGSDEIKRLIQERARVAELLARALDDGMRTLRQDGIEKVLAGVTDLAQVSRVCVR